MLFSRTALPAGIVLLAASAFVAAQQGAKPNPLAPATMPPGKLLVFATHLNGLGEEIEQPWHVKATFEAVSRPWHEEGGSGGVPVSTKGGLTSGSYEETWYGPQNYRRSFTFGGVTHTDTSTPDGLFRSGDQNWPTRSEVRVRQLLVQPLVADQPLGSDADLRVSELKIGVDTLPCLFVLPPAPAGASSSEIESAERRAPRMCFAQNAPILRIAAGFPLPYTVSFARFVKLGRHVVAQDVEMRGDDSLLLRVHVDAVEAAPAITHPLAAPAGATLIASPVKLPWQMLVRLPTSPPQPFYPAGALQERLQGTVRIEATISPDGTVGSAKVLDGPRMLRESALDFVRKSRFAPFLVAGKPAEVNTEADVTFDQRLARQQMR